jgi:hypothetical protein
MVVVGKLFTAGPRPSPPTPPTPPPAVSCEGVVATCPDSPVVGPLWDGTVSLMKTGRWTVVPLREAMTLTRPPAVPVGAKVAPVPWPGVMVAALPRSTLQVTVAGAPPKVAV